MKRAYVVGSGPNGLTAAILLARAGVETTVFEAESTIGGGARSAPLTLPGFIHDICSAVHPLARSSPVFGTFPLADHGLEWVHPPLPLAHPLDDGSAAGLHQSVRQTAAGLGEDATTYRRLVQPIATRWSDLIRDVLGPFGIPRSVAALVRFSSIAPWPAAVVAQTIFRTEKARALFAGNAAHSTLPLEHAPSAAFGWVLAISAHGVGWPIPKGGSQQIANALASYFQSLGGRIVVDRPLRSLDDFEPDSLVLCDVTPRQLLTIAGNRLPENYRKKLARYRYGPGVFKIDWALDAPIPWKAADCAQAGTVHLGGTLAEIAASERDPWNGVESKKPFVLLAQPTLFDPSRAPAGKHIAWAYCHVPNGSVIDMTDAIEAQVERFAPGFRRVILARHTMNSADMQRHNANLIGGDINGGVQDLRQMFLRPTAHLYRTPVNGLYLCSSSTFPGGGVHGMCGYHAASMALRDAGIRSKR